MNANMIRAALAVAAGTLVANAAVAGDPVKFTGFAHGSQTVKFDLSPNSPYDNVTVSAGGFNTVYHGQSFVSYCVDTFELLPAFNTNNTSYAVADATSYFGAAKAHDVARLFGGIASRVDTALEEAAFQLALWEIKYETVAGPYRLATGNAKFWDTKTSDGNAVTLAQSWLDGLSSYDGHVQLHVLQSVGRPGKQDVVWATPVPEPGTWMMLAAGLAGVGFVARRRQSPRA